VQTIRTAVAIALLWTGAAVAANSPGTIPSVPPATIAPQERLVLQIDAAGDPHILDRRTTADAAPEIPSADLTRETLTHGTVKNRMSASADTAVVTLWSSGRDTRLLVENGFDHPIAYTAVLIGHRNGRVVSAPTSTCPVKAHGIGIETWPGTMDGIELSRFRVITNGDLACNGGSTLAVAPGPPPEPPPAENNCQAGEVMRSGLSVSLEVAPSDGTVRNSTAIWTLNGGKSPAPAVLLDYPLTGDNPTAAPQALRVLEIIGIDPPPASPTASIVMFVNGVERTRRPWNGYAQNRSTPPSPAQNGARPVAFYGLVPFNAKRADGTSDEGLASLLTDIGAGKVTMLEVRVVGSSGETLNSGQLAVGASPARDPAVLGPLLAQARAKAAAPEHCAPQPQASR
jgi:hypothetical protein